MISVPMIYVNPITGPHAGKKMFCYVCNLNTKSVIAVFVRSEVLDEPLFLDIIRRLLQLNPQLEPFVVCLSGPRPALVEKLQALGDRAKALHPDREIPLTLLPSDEAEDSVYQSLPIDPDRKFTVLLYSGRQVKWIQAGDSLLETFFPDGDQFAFVAAPDGDEGLNALEASPVFQAMNRAAQDMLRKT